MKYALIGYNYQHYLACLLLAMMDTERKISRLSMEIKADHQFDDIALEAEGQNYFLQIKDFNKVEVSDVELAGDHVKIKAVPHKLSSGINVIFFKNIALKCNDKVLGFQAQKIDHIYLVSLGRETVEKRMANLYKDNVQRRQVIEKFFAAKLDDRILDIKISQLPSILVFDTRLVEKSVRVSRKILEFVDLLHIEGKPGVGKSHLVTYLQKVYPRNILYRFWISNQDREYEKRLRYSEFIANLIRQIFSDQKPRNEEEILNSLRSGQRTFILDGMDHVENYHPQDLEQFISFIERARVYVKVIVLSRPLKRALSWKKQVLGNWNGEQTKKVLKERFYIEEYEAWQSIYRMTEGYPILVKYIAEQYKKDGVMPEFSDLNTVNHYYSQLFSKETGKQAIALFVCFRGFVMHSEIKLFLGEIAGAILEEMVRERPYLFEIKLNRISLYHDSLITFLKNTGAEIKVLKTQVNELVFQSLMGGSRRFQSRLLHFDLARDQTVAVVARYCSISVFKKNMCGVIDFEAIMEFYRHIRQLLLELSPEQLSIKQLYDLTLILNLIERDHLSTQNDFYDTYLRLLTKNGYTSDDISSSRYLFGMLLYQQTNDGSFLNGIMSDSNYDTSRFYTDLEAKIGQEREFFANQDRPFLKKWIDTEMKNIDSIYLKDTLQEIFVNVYLHEHQHHLFPEILSAVEAELEGNRSKAKYIVYRNFIHLSWRDNQFDWLLDGVNKELYARGIFAESNPYMTLSIRDFLAENQNDGSYDLTEKLQNYLRLALHQNRIVDLESISSFWTKYYNRKDYTLYGLPYALPVFEHLGLIHWQDTVRLITHVQEISEKGYRNLLLDYIHQHEPKFLTDILKRFNIQDLHIPWFLLKPDYLNVLPMSVYRQEFDQQLDYHYSHREIDVQDVENVLLSNKVDYLLQDLKSARFTVSLKEGDNRVDLLAKLNVKYIQHKESYSYQEKSGQERYEQGILDHKNQEIIQTHQLTAPDVALFGDGYYTALANPEIYRYFKPEVLRSEMISILFNALIGKTTSSAAFNVTWLMPGTIIKLMADAHMDEEIRELFDSLVSYLELSMFKIETAGSL